MPEKDPWTSIPVRKSTKKLMRKFMGALSMKTGEDYSFDTAIRALIKFAPEVPISFKEEQKNNTTST